jgi:lipopolysaccharide export system protein LptC
MAFEANLASGTRRYRLRTAAETERAFVKAKRHSRLVGFLRVVLPATAVLVFAAYFVSSRMSMSVTVGDTTASIDGIQVADGNLRMTNPKLKGSDKKNGSYIIGADYADQDVKNTKIVKLHALHADVTNPSGGWSRMRADRGVFNTQSERLVMQDNITIATSSGITGQLKHATLEMKTHTLRSHRPVAFQLPNGTVDANALTFDSSTHTLTFRGKVKVHIDKKDQAGGAKSPPKAEAAAPQGTAAGPVMLMPPGMAQ